MNNFIIRTEDIKKHEIKKYYVETKQDRETIEQLKSMHQLLLVGSRGVGKTMLLKVAENEMDNEYSDKKYLPVYMSFSKGILVNSKLNTSNFRHWMFAKILNAFRSAMLKKGIITSVTNPFKFLFNNDDESTNSLDKFIEILEETWRSNAILNRSQIIKILGINAANYKIIDDIDFVKEVIQQFCTTYNISKVVLLFDEACHNFIPEQQREFFTLFRDLRNSYICCKAAVYPGITNFGTIQTFHDVVTRKIDRNILDIDYKKNMREIIKNQLPNDIYNNLVQYGEELDVLIYCSSGNPRLLLKSVEQASNGFKRLKKQDVNKVIKDFYRIQIWNEHTKLSNTYSGHKVLIDWGRLFLEESVLIETMNKNVNRKPQQSIFFAIHRDSPEAVKRAVRILEYSGIVSLHTAGTKVKTEIYDRYQINFGIVIASETGTSIIERCSELKKGLSTKLYTEYGKNSRSYVDLPKIEFDEEDISHILSLMLSKSIDILDITISKRTELRKVGFITIGDILKSTEAELQTAYYVGPYHSRKIYNTAYNAAIEYISG